MDTRILGELLSGAAGTYMIAVAQKNKDGFSEMPRWYPRIAYTVLPSGVIHQKSHPDELLRRK